MKYYRLKEEAFPFFDKNLQTKVYDLQTWTEKYNVNENAIEEVEPCYITYGIDRGNSMSLGGWSHQGNTDKGAHFCFTIHFPSMKYREYDEFSKGDMSRRLMDKIQQAIRDWCDDWSDDCFPISVM